MRPGVYYSNGPQWVKATGPSPAGEVFEVTGFRGLQLTLKVIGFEGASAPVLWIAMETGMRYAQDFVPLGRFLPMAADGMSCTRTFDGVIRFVRWNVVQFEGATAAAFVIEGQALP